MSHSEQTSLETEPNSHQNSPRGKRWAHGITVALGILTVVGTVLRLTIKDSIPIISILYYATPLAVLTLSAAWCLVACAVRRGKYLDKWIIATILLALWWASVDWGFEEPVKEKPDQTISVLFWNVARHKDLTDAAKFIRSVDADIVGLVEVVGSARDRRAFWNQQLPHYDVTILGGGIQLLAKGTSGEAIPHNLHFNSEARELEVTVDGQTLTCFVVDIESDLIRSRKTALEKLATLAEERSEKPVLIVGDFNTPPDSVHFKELRSEHSLAFEHVGTGYRPTWPVPVPVLMLDQGWTNSRIDLISCTHLWSSASDHRPVLTTVQIPED